MKDGMHFNGTLMPQVQAGQSRTIVESSTLPNTNIRPGTLRDLALAE